MKKIKSFVLRLFLHPLVGGLATVCGVLAGYLGSHYDQLIFRSFYPFFWSGTVFQWEATSFWIMTLLFGSSFTATFWAQSVTSKATNSELQEALKELVTVPPRGFIQSYKSFAVSSVEFYGALAPAKLPAAFPDADLRQAIRVQLEILVKTVMAYDSHGVGTVYGANIMLFHEASSSFFTSNKTALASRTKCIETGVDISNLSGVLDLELDLSVRSDTGILPDDKLTELALPIPKPGSGSSLATHAAIVPGAPYAFATRNAIVYEDQQELLNEVAGNRHFSMTVSTVLTTILNAQSKDVQSLVCIPLFPLGSASASSVEPLAVLNIHKNIPDRYAAEKFVLLGPLLAPMTHILGSLVEEL